MSQLQTEKWVKWLDLMAAEIRAEGHAGWGNTCEQIASEIKALSQQEAEPVADIHPAVMAFARAMQHKLDKNKHKDGKGWERNPDGSRNGWAGCSVEFLRDKLSEEHYELMDAVVRGDDLDAIQHEAADVGNIAMMLADVCGALPYPPKPAPLPQPVASVPQKEHDLQDVRCGCCGYMTYHREHMGCIRAAQPSVPQDVEEFIAAYGKELPGFSAASPVKRTIHEDDLRTFLAQRDAGYVKVPVEPTGERIDAGIRAELDSGLVSLSRKEVASIYRAMIADPGNERYCCDCDEGNCTLNCGPKTGIAAGMTKADYEFALTTVFDAQQTFRLLRRLVDLLLESKNTLGPEDHELRARIEAMLISGKEGDNV